MLIVYMFDTGFTLRGILPALEASCVLRRNGVGTFSLRVPEGKMWHRFQPGWHLALQEGDKVMMTGIPDSITTESQAGVRTVTLTGRSHARWLADALTLPSPGKAPDDQSDTAYYAISGEAHTLAARLITEQCGQSAHPRLRRPIMLRTSVTTSRDVSMKARFTPVIDEMQKILGDELTMSTTLTREGVTVNLEKTRDMTRRIRLDDTSGAITSWKLERSAPTVTDVLVAGGGQGTDRTLHLTSGNENEWGTRAMEFKDRRDTTSPADLEKAGQEALHAGQAKASITLDITDSLTRRFGTDFYLGDRITVALADGVTVQDVVQSAEVKYSPDGRVVKLQVGPVAEDVDPPALVRQVRELQRQLRHLQTI